MKFHLAVVYICTIFAAAACTANDLDYDLASGIYGDLTLAVDKPNGLVSGYFESEGGGDGQGASDWSCNFYFYGKIDAEGRAAISALAYSLSTRQFDLTSGEVLPERSPSGARAIRIRLNEYPPGCARGQDFSEDSPQIGLDEARSSREFRLIMSEKAKFYSDPDATRPEGRYVVRGDVVDVIKKKDAFVKVNYRGINGVATGWLKDSDLQALD